MRRALCLGTLAAAVLCPLFWTVESSACNARKKDSIHAHLHAKPALEAISALNAVNGRVPCSGGRAGIYPCRDVDLLSFLPLGSIGATGSETGNDVWGWTDPATGKEYAIMGLSGGVVFIDVSDPENPLHLGKLPTATIPSPWRDLKVYENHAFIVADRAEQHGMQVFDLRQLRGVTAPRAWTATTRYTEFGSAHNIAVNERTGFAYALGSDTCDSGLHMIDVNAPANPRFAGCFADDGYTHDAQCVIYGGADARYRGREICFASNEDTLTIVDVTDKSAPVQISRIGYSGAGYTHQSWLTENHRFLLMDDESDERNFGHRTRTYVWDVRDLENPIVIGRYTAPTNSVDHNLYIHNGFAFQANYQAGLRILDLEEVGRGRLSEVAYFDIVPNSDDTSFGGSWSVYPYFESGTVAISNVQQGLFLLRPTLEGFSLPAAPASLTAEVNGVRVSLAWQDASSDEEGFHVYRRRGQGSFSRIATLAADEVSYLDTEVEPSTVYRYQVSAFNGAGEQRSNEVRIETAAPQPVGVEVEILSPQPYEVGDLLEFRGTFTGPVVSGQWRFGAEGLSLDTAPCGPASFCAKHVFGSPGLVEVSLEAVGDFGQVASAVRQLEVVEGDTALVTERGLLKSVIFGPRGNTGTFKTSLWVHNAGDLPSLVELSYLPRGVGDAGRVRRSVTVEAGGTLYVENLLPTVFQVEAGQGSVELSYRSAMGPADPRGRIRAISRSFVELAAGGSFGQFVGEDAGSRWSADPKTAIGILESDAFISTLLAVNLDGTPGAVTIELLDAAGVPVGEPAVFGLPAHTMRFQRTAVLFPEAAGRQGPFTARFTSNGVRFAASATLLETGSEDQIFLSARDEAVSPVVYFVPRVVRATGQFDTSLTSWLVASNPSTSPTRIDVELWLRGQDNSEPLTARRTISAGETLVVEDVLRDLFFLDGGTGALRVTWANDEGIAPKLLSYGFARTPGPDGGAGDRFGMLVGSMTEEEAVAGSAVQFGAELSDVFRSSFGLVNLSSGPSRVRLTLRGSDGAEISSVTLGLRPRQHLERTLLGIFDGLEPGSNWTVETTVLDGGPVLTYLANINASGDVFFVPGAP